MALKAILASLDEVDENLRTLYVETEDGFVLDLENIEQHPKATSLHNALKRKEGDAKKFKSERDKLKQDLEDLADIDPAAARAALEKVQEFEDKQLMDAGKVDELVEQKVERMRSQFESQSKQKDELIAALEADKTSLSGQLNEIVVNQAVIQEATAHGVRPGAIDDIVNRAKMIFQAQEGTPIALDSDGNEIMGADARTPMSVSEWVQDLAKGNGEHLFQPNSGSGANGSGGKPTKDGVTLINPDQKGDFLEELAAGTAEVRE